MLFALFEAKNYHYLEEFVYICSMSWSDLNNKELILIAIIFLMAIILPIGRWLYLRSMRIRNRLQMSYLFTNIAHELLTPLTIIAASVEHLRNSQPSEKKEYDLMDLNIQRTERLLQQILETSKSQAGSLKLLVSQGDVMKYITETARCTEPLMEQKELKFDISCKPESMMGWIDTDKLDKIIFNLLSNAVKYTQQNGKVSLHVSTNQFYDHVIIRVSDNGCGISKDKMKNLFTRYFDGDYRRNRTIGTGLGLSLTRDLVFLHKGTIKCKSVEGQGTTFIVDLPIGKEAFSPSQIDEHNKVQIKQPASNIIDFPTTIITTPANITATATTDENAYRVLIVEDNAELLMLMQQLLCSKYQIFTASNGQEALNLITHHDLDIIISDVMMPEMDGLELTRRIKQDEEFSHLPIILLTAKTQSEDHQEALEAGADDYITKPFRLKDLQLHIDNIVENRQRIRRATPTDTESSNKATAQVLSMDEEFLQKAYNCINEHIDDSDYDRETFAADMGASASTLYNKLRTLTGMNVTAFIRDIRIKTACQLAKDNPDWRVSDIAYRVGFKDPKYFATSFKKEMGMQPKEYFDRLRSETEQSASR